MLKQCLKAGNVRLCASLKKHKSCIFFFFFLPFSCTILNYSPCSKPFVKVKDFIMWKFCSLKWCHFVMRILWAALELFNSENQTKTGSLYPIISWSLFKSHPRNDPHHFLPHHILKLSTDCFQTLITHQMCFRVKSSLAAEWIIAVWNAKKK